MLMGVPKEIKDNEYRVGMTPGSVREAVAHGHEVLVERGAGAGIGVDDATYRAAGARIVDTAQSVFERAAMIVKVKEPQAVERAMLHAGQVLFTYLHLAPDPEQAADLQRSGATCIAYETITSATGGLPLLAPMSKVAGRMAVQAGANALEKAHGGRGLLLGGVPGVEPARVVIIGGGVVGRHAAEMAVGLRADVTILDRSVAVLDGLDAMFQGTARTVYSTHDTLERYVLQADLVIGAVLVPGAAAPKLVTRQMVAAMQAGAVIVDVAIDQGGCCETARPTTHTAPTYVVDEVVHYCVANMPGGVPLTSTHALNNATLPYVLTLADKGWTQALSDDAHLRNGLNIHAGQITCPEVAAALGQPYVDPARFL